MACYEYKGVKYTEEELVKLLQSQQPKTRRILEVQSDLFQKGRDKEDLISKENIGEKTLGDSFELNSYKYVALIEDDIYTKAPLQNTNSYIQISEDEYKKSLNEYNKNKNVRLSNKENQFLQLLNKDNNWVTFFVKSIIQTTARETIQEINEQDVENKVKELERQGRLKIEC